MQCFTMQCVAEVTLRLRNLKRFTLDISRLDDDESYGEPYEEHEASMWCSCILKGAPLLKTIRISVHCSLGRSNFDYFLRFVNNFLSLAKDFPKTVFSVSEMKTNTL